MWAPPEGADAAIAAHLVNASEIARRAGVSRSAVSNWLQRHPSLSALAVGEVGDGSFVYWWPQVERELHNLRLPSRTSGGYRIRKSNLSTKGEEPVIIENEPYADVDLIRLDGEPDVDPDPFDGYDAGATDAEVFPAGVIEFSDEPPF